MDAEFGKHVQKNVIKGGDEAFGQKSSDGVWYFLSWKMDKTLKQSLSSPPPPKEEKLLYCTPGGLHFKRRRYII